MNSKNAPDGQVQYGLRAIETEYKGYRFRSRLEARWAVFFDALNIEWVYEEEGYDLPSGWYLPDFRIDFEGDDSDFKPFIEIKPKGFVKNAWKNIEFLKMNELATASNEMSFILAGDPFNARMRREIHIATPRTTNGVSGRCDMERRLYNKIDEFMTRLFVPMLDLRNPKVFAAALKARQARFEHGERG